MAGGFMHCILAATEAATHVHIFDTLWFVADDMVRILWKPNINININNDCKHNPRSMFSHITCDTSLFSGDRRPDAIVTVKDGQLMTNAQLDLICTVMKDTKHSIVLINDGKNDLRSYKKCRIAI